MIRLINLYALNSKYAKVHPLEKVLLVFISLISCSYTENIYLIMLNIIFFSILSINAKNPFNMIKKFLSIVIIYSIFTTITLMFTYDVKYIIVLLLRGVNGGLTISFLALTTPLNHIVYLMSKNNLTREIADIAKSMETFILVIEKDFDVTFKAMKSRGGFGSFKKSIKDFAKVCSIVMRNLFFRWKEISEGLKNRCYNGKYNYNYIFNISKKRILLILFYGIVVLIIII
ncbi:energy-coupling factor transporter transmembrane component T family protein [Clostridium gasigenes]|uniref:energy-coupling factor transporter transmembrane component T family protein n=1 Tax=Clostridium gasigenes TaxID=94869 RepID=UPI001C0CC1CD|nr:energy-coupling factor transporter transmembrane protein EcfT [Clostridium gasigenes]MBU3108439.1 energy-coupling factor transporter transmembrane protein EcfT [Clostridium gasigenes]